MHKKSFHIGEVIEGKNSVLFQTAREIVLYEKISYLIFKWNLI